MVRLGIIGVGNMGSGHTKNIMEGKCPEIVLTAVADVKPARKEWLDGMVKEYGYSEVAFFNTAEEMLDSGLIDACIIAVPHYFHPPYAIACMERGIHVMSEKPAGVYTKQVREMNEAAKAHPDVVFGMMFNQRTNCIYRKMRELVQSGEYGEIRRTNWIITDWYRSQAYYDSGEWRATWSGEGGGVLLNQCPHNLDLWQWICGMPVKLRAFCEQGKYHNIEVEDDATLFATYANGATGTFITTTGEYPGTNRLEISGDLGKIVLEEGVLKWWKLGVPERKFCFESAEGFAQIPCEYVEIRPDEPETGHSGILQNLANAILYGEELLAPGYDGIKELTLSNAAYLSSWCGNKEIALPFDEQTAEEFAAELKKRADASNYKESAVVEKMSGEYSKRWQVRW